MFKHFCPCGDPIPAARFNAGYSYCMKPECVKEYTPRPTTKVEVTDFYGRKSIIEITPHYVGPPRTAMLTKASRKIVVNRKATNIEVDLECAICGNTNRKQLGFDGIRILCKSTEYCATPLPGARYGA